MEKHKIYILVVLLVIIGVVVFVFNKNKALSPQVEDIAPVIEETTPENTTTPKEIVESKPKTTPKVEQKNTDKITEKDTGKTFTFNKGDKFTVSVPERAGGYFSISMTYAESSLLLESRGLKPSTTINGGQNREWNFIAQDSGTTDVKISAIETEGGPTKEIFSTVVVVK